MNTHNGHSGVLLTEQTWFTHKQKLQRNLNRITQHYLAQIIRYKYATSVRSSPEKPRVVNCFPSLLITWITSESVSLTPYRLNFFKCWQLSAIRQTVFPLNPCWKENISFDSNKTVLIFVLITKHYTYNCTKLMHNKKVFYTLFNFCLLYLHN